MPPSPSNNGFEPSGPRKIIRSDRVDYPSVQERLERDRSSSAPRRLRPARDAGLSIERRAARENRRAAQTRRNLVLAALAILLVLFGLGARWQLASNRKAANVPLERSSLAGGGAVAAPTDPAGARPTPLFASYKSIQLRLPVAPKDLTEVGFHQASYAYALRLKTSLPDADMSKAKNKKGTKRDLSKQSDAANAKLTGSVLRMWRSRPGKPDTAVDVGADPGTRVLAPLTGTVVLVKSYKLYDRYPDYQIHIQPDGHPKVDCVIIHIKEPSVQAGDRVAAGVTPIARVRKFSDKINVQLGRYTPSSGDHIHLQLNDVNDPEYKGLKGAIDVSGS